MAIQVNLFRIFLASPSDMEADREIVFSAVDEANAHIASKGVQFRIVGWENDVSPGIGTYTQEVINRQLFSEYDLMIALFATRLGRPTPKSASGTVEEIEHAIAKDDSPFGQQRIQVFFRQTKVNSLDCDLDQLAALRKFRTRLEADSILYRDYEDDGELEKQIRNSLFKAAEHIEKQSSRAPKPENAVTVIDNSTGEEELGLYEYFELFESQGAEGAKHIENYVVIMNQLSEETNQFITKLALLPTFNNAQKAKTINEYASILETKSSMMISSIQLARKAYSKAMNYGLEVVHIQLSDIGASADDVKALLQSLDELEVSLQNSTDAVVGVRAIFTKFPRLTTHLNKAKRTLLQSFNEFDGLNSDIIGRIVGIRSRVFANDKLIEN